LTCWLLAIQQLALLEVAAWTGLSPLVGKAIGLNDQTTRSWR
jgi:hypothetical protein